MIITPKINAQENKFLLFIQLLNFIFLNFFSFIFTQWYMNIIFLSPYLGFLLVCVCFFLAPTFSHEWRVMIENFREKMCVKKIFRPALATDSDSPHA
jgi:hypothetical protein